MSLMASFWLNQITGANVLLFEQVSNFFLDLDKAYELAKRKEKAAFMKWGATFASKAIELAAEDVIEKRLKWLKENKFSIISRKCETYPSLLNEIAHPPSLLYVKGRLQKETTLPISMVGMRKNTAYGEAVAIHLGAELSRAGATIVSGMAAGIDSFAAKGALSVEDAAYPTIAVLGSGIDVIYPNTNARLYDEIAERGAVISEFLPGTRPFRENFPIRNRVISGLSRGVVIVEAGERSGTSITANYAHEQGRDVFAVPGRITDVTSIGPNGMIQRGEAKPIFCAADILLEYGVSSSPKTQKELDLSALGDIEKQIVKALQQGEKSADELSEILSIAVQDVNSGLTSLRFSGIIKQLPGRVFSIY